MITKILINNSKVDLERQHTIVYDPDTYYILSLIYLSSICTTASKENIEVDEIDKILNIDDYYKIELFIKTDDDSKKEYSYYLELTKNSKIVISEVLYQITYDNDGGMCKNEISEINIDNYYRIPRLPSERPDIFLSEMDLVVDCLDVSKKFKEFEKYSPKYSYRLCDNCNGYHFDDLITKLVNDTGYNISYTRDYVLLSKYRKTKVFTIKDCLEEVPEDIKDIPRLISLFSTLSSYPVNKIDKTILVISTNTGLSYYGSSFKNVMYYKKQSKKGLNSYI